VLVAEIALPPSVPEETQAQFFRGLLEDVRALPGVRAAGMTSYIPMVQTGGSTEVWTPEQPERRSFSQQAHGREVLPGYFGAMGMKLVAGRDLEETDRTGTPPVMVISQAMARRLFSTENAVGRKVVADLGDAQPVTLDVVGVVADARLDGLGDEPPSAMYLSFFQYQPSRMRLAIRTAADPQGITKALRDLVSRRDKDVPVEELATLPGIIRKSTEAHRALAGTVTSLSAFSLLLAAIGLFGVQAYQVNQRHHEIGIRMALGARRSHILAAVLRQGLLVIGVGLAAGLALGLALTRLMGSLLYAVAPTDLASVAAAAVCLLAVGTVACLIPALRAAALDPVKALRCE
jgi:predicted permease